MLQVYGRGNNHKIYNNQFIGNQIDGVSFRIDGSAEFYDNTVAKTGDNNVRVYKGTLKATNNLLAQPRMKGAISDSAYIYMESGANVVEVANMKLKTYDPLVPSPVGYIKGICKETTTPNPCPECPPVPTPVVPVEIIMSDGTRYKITK